MKRMKVSSLSRPICRDARPSAKPARKPSRSCKTRSPPGSRRRRQPETRSPNPHRVFPCQAIEFRSVMTWLCGSARRWATARGSGWRFRRSMTSGRPNETAASMCSRWIGRAWRSDARLKPCRLRRRQPRRPDVPLPHPRAHGSRHDGRHPRHLSAHSRVNLEQLNSRVAAV